MALDKLVDSTQLDSDLTSVANAIRTKGGTSASLAFPAGFVSAINDISGGDDFFVSVGGANYYSISSSLGTHFMLDITAATTRRSVWRNTGDDSVWLVRTSSDYSNFSGYYPIEVPSGATRVSVSATGPANAGVQCFSYESDYVRLADSGWVNLPIVDYSLAEGTKYIGISFRANSSNSKFSSSTQPTNISISFA